MIHELDLQNAQEFTRPKNGRQEFQAARAACPKTGGMSNLEMFGEVVQDQKQGWRAQGLEQRDF